MSGKADFLEEFFEKIHETLIEKYFVVAGGHNVWVDLNDLVLRRPYHGRTWINFGGRALQNIYPGLGWAPEESYYGFYLRICAANVGTFKRGMQSKSDASEMQMPRHDRIKIELFSILQSDMFPQKLLPLLPRSDIELSDILDRFTEAFHSKLSW